MEKLDNEKVQAGLKELEGWKLEGGELRREFKFRDFVGSIAFVQRVAELAEAAGHHPDIDIRYNRVRLALATHDAGGITKKDLAMARKVNDVPGGRNS
jgi:4a-hydroxytetrahydrobiopterin dehydratase